MTRNRSSCLRLPNTEIRVEHRQTLLTFQSVLSPPLPSEEYLWVPANADARNVRGTIRRAGEAPESLARSSWGPGCPQAPRHHLKGMRGSLISGRLCLTSCLPGRPEPCDPGRSASPQDSRPRATLSQHKPGVPRKRAGLALPSAAAAQDAPRWKNPHPGRGWKFLPGPLAEAAGGGGTGREGDSRGKSGYGLSAGRGSAVPRELLRIRPSPAFISSELGEGGGGGKRPPQVPPNPQLPQFSALLMSVLPTLRHPPMDLCHKEILSTPSPARAVCPEAKHSLSDQAKLL